MRVDFCALDTVTLDCKAGERIEIALEIIPADTAEWEVWEDTGEFLDAVSFYSTSGDEASTGLRDPEWMEWQYPLRCLRAPTDKLLRGATYEATASAKLWIQSAVAWTTNPSPQEEDSPNYAVDKALPSKGGH
ncbi:hypothetical protein [uncultured Roseibium sp.]|uniref:hypothetical protein n=1 Tax=uncultured Roseibium sp. TaxID=1936171 RepID=UPI00321749BC